MKRNMKNCRWTSIDSGGLRRCCQAGTGREAKHAAPINRIYGIAVALSLLYLSFGVWFIHYSSNLSRTETIGYIEAAIEQARFYIEEHVDETFDTLMATAMVAQDRDLLSDDAVLRALVNGLSAHSTYVGIGFADRDGQAVWIDVFGRKHRADLSQEGFFQRALTGENALSNARYDNISKQAFHYYAVPIYDSKSDMIEGVMFAAHPQSELRAIINNSLYAGKGLAHIIDDQGNYVIKSASPLVLGIGDNIFDLERPVDTATEQEIRENLASRNSGHLIEAFYGQNRLVAYAPLDINNWYVFYAVPENLVSAGLKKVTVGAIVSVSISTVIFIFFIALIHRVNDKTRSALEDLAFVDPVTGCRNYHKFLLDAQVLLKSHDMEQYALCYVDIKGLKYINDLFGRDVGDRLLRYHAEHQASVTQEHELSGRIGEDSFVTLRRFQSKQEIELRFASAAHHLAVFPETFSKGFKPELYGGAYVLNKDENLSLIDILDRAIAAQDDAKQTGGAVRFRFYSEAIRQRKLWDAEIESRMEAALEYNEFEIYLQPKIDIQNGDRILGAEALVRWVSPEKGLIPPGRFIELFEKNGFIVQLDTFVFVKACRYYKEVILDSGLPHFILSVNVSRLGLMQPDFMRTYTEIRQSFGIPDGCIELEFTESLVFGNHALFQTTVKECKSNGFLCSLDDFGSGYSSLNILKSIYVDVLKLDRQFFLYDDEMTRGQELVKNIIAMAKALNMKTVAEGIDDAAQVAQLRAMGCDAVQGYVFAKPMPEEEFTRYIEAWQTEGQGA